MAAPCGANSGHGWSPATSVMATITPPPGARHLPVRRLGREHEPLGGRVEGGVPQLLVDTSPAADRLEAAEGQYTYDVEPAQLGGRGSTSAAICAGIARRRPANAALRTPSAAISAPGRLGRIGRSIGS